MIEIKDTREIPVAFVGGKGLHTFDKEESRLKSLLENKGIHPAGSTIGIFFGDPNKVGPENVRWECCIPLPEEKYAKDNNNTGGLKEMNDVNFKTLDTLKAASLVHKGSFETLGKSFAKIFAWISENDYKVAGPVREIYFDDSTTEIQIPIE